MLRFSALTAGLVSRWGLLDAGDPDGELGAETFKQLEPARKRGVGGG